MPIDKKFINTAVIEKLQRKVKNQRGVLNAQNAQIHNLKDSIENGDLVLADSEHERLLLQNELHDLSNEVDKLQAAYDKLDTRYQVVNKHNTKHLAKLVALNHVMNRGRENVALR